MVGPVSLSSWEYFDWCGDCSGLSEIEPVCVSCLAGEVPLASLASTQVLLPNTPQTFRMRVEVSARNCSVSIQPGCTCFGVFPAPIAKTAKPEMQRHRRFNDPLTEAFRNVWFLFVPTGCFSSGPRLLQVVHLIELPATTFCFDLAKLLIFSVHFKFQDPLHFLCFSSFPLVPLPLNCSAKKKKRF